MANVISLTEKQKESLVIWLDANSKVKGWLDGYSLGRSYIDTRARKGAKRDGREAYVKLDQDTAIGVPELAGQSAHAIREFLQRLKDQR